MCTLGGRHSTEEAFALLTQPSQVWFPHLTAGKIEIEPKNLALRTCHSNLLGDSALGERTTKNLMWTCCRCTLNTNEDLKNIKSRVIWSMPCGHWEIALNIQLANLKHSTTNISELRSGWNVAYSVNFQSFSFVPLFFFKVAADKDELCFPAKDLRCEKLLLTN